VSVGQKNGWHENIAGENLGMVFGASIFVIGASIVGYFIGAGMERPRRK